MRFVADATDIPTKPRPLPAPGLGQREITGTNWTISNLFLGLIAAFLGLAAVMAVLPEYARLMVFPFVLAGWLASCVCMSSVTQSRPMAAVTLVCRTRDT